MYIVNRTVIELYSDPDYSTKEACKDIPVWQRVLTSLFGIIFIILSPVTMLLRCLGEALWAAFIVPRGYKKIFAQWAFGRYMPDTLALVVLCNLDQAIWGASEKVFNLARDAVARHYQDQIELDGM